MNVDEAELIGKPLDEVPIVEPSDEDCRGRRSKDGVFKGYCRATPGRGTDHVGEGRCKHHGGKGGSGGPREGSGGKPGNTNAVTHGAYAQCNPFYTDVLDEPLRQLVDDIFEDYLEEYRSLHGEPILGHETELFRLSVTHVKDISLDTWATERPHSLESGHPMVDRETRYTQGGREYHKYKESVVLAAQQKLSRDRRQWLKDLGLLKDAESDAAEALTGLTDVFAQLAE